MSRAVLVRGERAWRKLLYRHPIALSVRTKRILQSMRAYRAEPLGDVVLRLLDGSYQR